MTAKNYFFLIALLGSMTALAPFSIDMYLPGFTAIAVDLKTTASKVSLSLSGYFIGISAGQLLYGPLLDKYGRKKPLYYGLSVYILASIGCALAKDINTLIVLRCIEAIGGCAAAVAAVALVRDLFPISESAKVFSLLMLVVGASPMIAPTIGGYVTAAYGWQVVFLILAVMGTALLIASALWLPNTYQPDTTITLKPRPIIKTFATVLAEPQFYTYAFTASISLSGLFAYVASSPVIFMQVYNTSQKTYGWIFAFLSIGLIGSSQLNALLLKHFKSEQIIKIMLITQLFFSIVLVAASYAEILTLPLLLILLFMILSCVGILNPNAAALSLAPFTKNAGSASALMGAIQMGAGALISIIISFFDKPSTLPMSTAMASSALLAFFILKAGSQFIKQPINENPNASMMH